jgi:hypothetical protein
MKCVNLLFIILLAFSSTLIIAFNRLSDLQENKNVHRTSESARQTVPGVTHIAEIPLPQGFTRITVLKNCFGEWLRNFKLRKNNTVYLYNGQPIAEQNTHYAVLDLSTGSKDLQQCADAIMRLRAEYYFSKKEYNKIFFSTGTGTRLDFESYARGNSNCYSHDCLLKFLEKVFISCGTYTVDAMTKPININYIEPGDVFVKAGAPGHAMIVADVAINTTTHKKIYLLAQSFMPAQDMHIVINPTDKNLSPWYEVNNKEKIITPGWVFNSMQLGRWK